MNKNEEAEVLREQCNEKREKKTNIKNDERRTTRHGYKNDDYGE